MYFISLNSIFSRISSNVCENFGELSPSSAEEMQGQEQKQSFQIPQSSLTQMMIIKHPVRYAGPNLVLLQTNATVFRGFWLTAIDEYLFAIA